MKFLRIAFRNVIRNRKRTAITLSTILICAVASILARGIIGAMHDAIVSNITKSLTGDFQAYPLGYMDAADAMPLEFTFSPGGAVEQDIEKSGAVSFSRRIRFGGLLFSRNEMNSVFSAVAVEPERELQVCPKLTSIFLTKGRFLDNETNSEIVISGKLAEAMEIDLSDTVAIMTKSSFGSMSAKEFTVVGILEITVPGIDPKLAYLSLSSAQELLGFTSEYTEISASAPTIGRSLKIAQDMKSNMEGKDYQVFFWTDNQKLFSSIISFQKIIINVVTIVFFIIAIAAVFNTMLMAVMERIKEIGILRALGIRRKQVVSLILTEAGIIGFSGGILGIILGSSITFLLGIKGISFCPPGSSICVALNPTFTPDTFVFILGLAIITSITGSLYPSLLASRLGAMDAIRRV